MENKLFTPNPNKLLHTVTIQMFENCANTNIISIIDKKITYHELIGLLETVKQGFIWNQREINKKIKYKPQKK